MIPYTNCRRVVSGITLPAASKASRANGVQTPLGTAWYSSVCRQAPIVNVDAFALCTLNSAEMSRSAPSFVTVDVKATASPGAAIAGSVASVAVSIGCVCVAEIVSVTAIAAQVFGPAVQVPDWQVSGPVQLSPSLHDVPLDASTSPGHAV